MSTLMEPGRAPARRRGMLAYRAAGAVPAILREDVVRSLAGLAAILLALCISVVSAALYGPVGNWLAGIQLALGLVGLWQLRVLARVVELRYGLPLAGVRAWARRTRHGGAGQIVATAPDARDWPAGLADDLRAVELELHGLRERLDEEVRRHTLRLEQQARSLQVLYEVAGSVNVFSELDDLLGRVLHTLIDVVGAEAGTVHLRGEGGQGWRLVAGEGSVEPEIEDVPETRARADRQESGPAGEYRVGPWLGEDGEARGETITVPLSYHGRTSGVYRLYVDAARRPESDGMGELLISIGRHLGIAVDRAEAERRAKRLTIMQERSLLAHELHDSLAQTLASLRLQVRLLDDSLGVPALEQARVQARRIREHLDVANSELRSLLAYFRAPIDRRGLLPALEEAVGRFRRETGIVTFFQKECPNPRLPAHCEIQVLRVVQESLANIRKHSGAHAVRILFRCDGEGAYHVMVEDDGIGMSVSETGGAPGEHLGLSILRERARRLNGELLVDSEPAEGTRIELNFRAPEP